MNRVIYTFRSSSSKDKTYETIAIPVNTKRGWEFTCNCPGWTRRVDENGQRLCVHTRVVQAGNPEADPLFVSKSERLNLPRYYPTQGYEEYERPAIKVKLGPVPIVKPPSPSPKPKPTRKFSFDD